MIKADTFSRTSRRSTDRALPLTAGILLALTACSTAVPGLKPEAGVVPGDLYDIVSALDAAVFDAFNNCAVPEQLEKHAGYFAPDVEFYHDTGGVTWTRKDMLANTQKYACGKFRRELVPRSLKVFPIKGFGAIAEGEHRFCQLESGDCGGMADFVMLWQKHGDQWRITRVFSYGHRPVT